MTVTNVLAALLPVVITILTFSLLRGINLRKEHRGRQILAVWLSPAVSLAGMVLVYLKGPKIGRLCRDLVMKGLSLTQMGGDAKAVVEAALNSWLPGIAVLAGNALIAAAFLLIKSILLPVMSSMWAERSSMELASDTWYEYDEDESEWFLRPKYRNVRGLYYGFACASAVLCAVLLIFAVLRGKAAQTPVMLFPVVPMIVLTEIFNFLSGYTKEEYLHTVGGEDISSFRLGAYHKLRKIYEALFSSALLVSHTGNEFGGKEGATELLLRYQNSDDDVERIVGDYYSHLKKRNGLFDVDLVSMTNTLLHKESAVVFNPFYRDLGDYLLLPLVHNLINDKKCLIVIGRGALSEDVIQWAGEVLKNYSRTRSLWRVRELSKNEPDCEIGVLSFSQIYNSAVINANASFFGEVGFVLLIEPSKMLVTSQSGLSIILEKTNRKDPPTFCACDHDVDGLVDTLSHVLQTNITNVIAAPVPRSVYTAMGWAASGDYIRQKLFDKQTHYLGNGVELAAVALKNQVPHVTWYGAEKAPVQDIRWIAGQYYPQICRYAHLPSQQKSIDERISFSVNLWGSGTRKEEFVIAEDEFCNLFASIRAYLTRGESQSFVNVISENYLLRDYMRYNRQLFMSDPKAVPAIAPYYAKTERNTVFRLILMMACAPVSEDYIAHELNMLGYEAKDIYSTLSNLIFQYTFVADTIISVKNVQEVDEDLVPIQVSQYSIPEATFNENFAATLKNAYFVVEDEKFSKEYIDARLFGHITQIAMPGQFLTYNGKLYKVHMVSPSIGCVLHRAADAYTGRRYYRQLRTYHLEEASEPLKVRRVMDLEIALERRDFSVSTTGYLDMADNEDLRTARVVDLSDDPGIGTYTRSYKNKSVLRISLPETDIRIRFTVCMLLSEMFRSVFPDAWPYLAVLSRRPEDIGGMLDKVNYHVDGAVDEDMIYVVEDSDMDLGLLEAVDNNLRRLFEIMTDYLDWHFEKMREAPAKDPVIPPLSEPVREEEKKRRSFFSRIVRRIRRLFGASDEESGIKVPAGKKPAGQPEEEKKPEGQDSAAGTAEAEPASPFEEPEKEEKSGKDRILEPAEQKAPGQEEGAELNADEDPSRKAGKDGSSPAEAGQGGTDSADSSGAEPETPPEETIVLHTEGEDLFAADGVPDDLDLLMPIKPSRYQKECFLKFGFDEIDARLDIEDVYSYLKARGWSRSDLAKARKRTELKDNLLDLSAENCCDFCGRPLTGVSYDRLADGRVRCNECSATAVNEVSEFKRLFRDTEMMMENIFNIRIPVSIAVRTTDARTIAKHVGRVFEPSSGVAVRALGFAQRKKGRYSLFIENGSPRLAVIDTTTHEMTHIWQYLNWKDSQIISLYRQRKKEYTLLARDIIYEGMAMWASVQLLYAMGETEYAWEQEQIAEARTDVYGIGFRLYRDRYDFVRSGDDPVLSPFMTFPPLDPAVIRKLFEEV